MALLPIDDPLGACPESTPYYSADFPAFESDQIWVGIDPDSNYGGLDAHGCGTGCIECLDEPSKLLNYHVRDNGSRFLRPARSGQNRNAEGYYSDLRSGAPERVPRTIVYERATCWKNGGTECFQDYCGCQPGPAHVLPGTLVTCGGPRHPTVYGSEPLGGQIPDTQGITDDASDSWPKRDNAGYDCRHIQAEHNPSRVPLSAGRMLVPVFHRDHACGANAMILATARIAASECNSGFANRANPGTEIYYGDVSSYSGRPRFDTMHVTGNTATIADDPAASPSARATIEVKNAALAYVARGAFPGAGGLLFGQLRNRVLDDGNGALGLWRTTYTGEGTSPDVAAIQLRSRSSDARVDAKLHIKRVFFEVYLFVLRVRSKVGAEFVDKQWPYARCRIQVWTELRTANPADLQGHPFYLRNGVAFSPPGYVEWRGWLGAFSAPPTGPLTVRAGNPLHELANALSAVTMTPLPGGMQGGSVTVRF